MKKLITLLMALAFIMPDLLGETGTVTLGSGTTSNSTTAHPTPYGTYYKNHRVQYLVLAGELASLGLAPGDITAIGFDVANVNNCSAMPNYTMMVKFTDANELTNVFDNEGYTTVWTSEEFLPENGWNTHTFSTPMYWDGTSNLLIDVCYDLVGGYTQNASVYYTATATNLANYYRNDTSPACGTSATATVSKNRANMQITGELASCVPPSGLTATDVTAHTALIGWTPVGSETSWNLVYGEAGFDIQEEGVVVYGVTYPYLLEDIEASTQYDVYVQSVCDDGAKELSAWAGPVTFKTLCVPISVFPWIESFEDVVIPAFPDCWLKESGNWVTTNNASSTYDADARTGTQFLRERYSASNSYIWTPGFAVEAGVSYDFSFWWAGDTYAGWDGDVFYNHLQTSEDAIHIETFVEAGTTTTKTYAHFLYTFVPDEDGIYYFAIRINSPSSPWYLSFDDFRFEQTPSCVAPTNLAVSEITQSGAKIDWTPGGEEPMWNLKYGDPGFDPSTEGTLVEDLTTNSYTITGLSANTPYQVYVQANCDGDQSPWAGPLAFVTECGSFTLPFTEDFTGVAVGTLPICWSVSGAGQTNWSVQNTTNAGGTAPEMRLYWSPGFTDISRLVTPILSAGDANNFMVSFDQKLDYYAAFEGAYIAVEYSVDLGENWEIIYQNFYSSTFGPKSEEFYFTVPEETDEFKLAFTFYGYVYNINGWYIDNIHVDSFVPANLSGNVSSARGPIEGAKVFTGGYEVFTDESGNYEILGIPAGFYDIGCEAEGFLTKLVEDFELEEGDNTLNFVLDFAQIAVDPESFEVDVTQGGELTEMLNISNPAGTAPLTWNAKISYSAKGDSYQHFNFSSNFSSNYKEDALLSGNSQSAGASTRENTTCPDGSLFGFEPDYEDWALVTSEEAPGYIAFQYFSDVDEIIGGITFWGGNLVNAGGWSACNDEDPMPFVIEFYTDDNGEPGDFVTSFTTSISRVDTQIPIGTYGNFYMYSLEFDEAIALSSGWVAIQGQTSTPDCWFMWAGTYEGVGTPYLQWDGTAFDIGDYALSLCLTGFEGTEWLSLSNNSGIVQPGDSEDIELTFNGADLEEGTYNATIKITHNGQSATKGLVQIPVTMNVVVGCAAPKNLTVSGITQNSAMLDWTAGSTETTWNLKYGEPGFDPATEGTLIEDITTKPYLLADLEGDTEYAFCVQAVCDDEVLSDWSVQVAFATLGDVITDFPWYESFEDVTIPTFPPLWFKENGDWVTTNNASSANDADARTGTQFLRESWSAVDEFMWTPGFVVEEGVSYDFSFWWAGDNYAGWTGDVFINTVQNSEDATQIGTSFIVPGTTTNKNYAQFLYTFIPEESGTYYFAVRVNATSNPWYLSFDDFEFNYTPSCQAPTGLMATDITIDSAVLDWTESGDASVWNLKYWEQGTQDTISVNDVDKPYILTDLNSNTYYSFTVQSDCGGGDLSAWAYSFTFITACDVMELPFAEDFEDAAFPPNCWVRYNIDGGGSEWIGSTTQNHTPGGLRSAYHQYYTGDQDGWLVSPPLQLPSSMEIILTFWSYNVYPGDYGENSVLVSTGSGNPVDGDFVTIWAPTSVTQAWEETELLLNQFAGETVYVAFRYTGNYAHSWYIDDVEIIAEVLGECPKPTDLTASDITQSSALLDWVEGGAEDTWNLKYGAPGFDPETEGTLIEGITSKPYLLEGLNPNTEYGYRVQADCGSSLSDWSNEQAFATACGSFGLPFAEDFEGVTFPPICWGRYDLNGDNVVWSSSVQYNNTPGGEKSARHSYSYGGGGLGSDGWLVTPAIELPVSTSVSLSFYSYNTWTDYYEENYVMLSTGSGDPASGDFVEIWTTDEVAEEWVETVLSLTEYAGETVYIAFRYVGYDGHEWYLDDVMITEVQAMLPGDANGDGIVDILDLTAIAYYIVDFNPDPFVFENADVNGDGVVDLSDIILTVNIIMGVDLKTMDLGLESATAHIYLNPNDITLISDGTLAGLQFEIYGLFAEQLDLLLPGYELVTNVKNGKLMGLIFNVNNTLIPAGKIKLFNISESANDLTWGEVGAANTVAQAVKVQKHVLMAEEEFAFSAYPNPSNGLVYADISLPHESMLVVTIVDMTGREVQILHRGILSEGTYQFRNDANNLLSSGVYFLKVEAVSSATSEVFTKQVKIIVMD